MPLNTIVFQERKIMLDIFKQTNSFLTRAKERSSFKYVLRSDKSGFFIEVCNTKLKPIADIDYRVYNGLDREILKLLDDYQKESFFSIDWEESSNKIYLHKYPKILELLKQSNKLYSDNDKKIEFEKDIKKLSVEINGKDDILEAVLKIDERSDFRLISSSYVLTANKIISIENTGENFDKIPTLNTLIKKENLEEYLSILFTYFKNIEINYDEYEIVFRDEKKAIKPAVIFEKVTGEDELILKISATIGNLHPDFFSNFNISKISLVNDLEKQINVYECDFNDVFNLYSSVYNMLNSIKRANKNATFSEEDGEFIIDSEIAKEFIAKKLHTVIESCELFGSEKLKSYNYNTQKPTLHINFKNKIDFLDSEDVTVNIGEEKFSLFDIINLYKKHSYIPLKEGQKSIIDKNYISKLERIFKKEGKKIKVSFFDLPEIEEMIAKKEQKVFKDSRKFYEGFNRLKNAKTRLPKLNNIKLRDYQKYGVKWLKYLYDNNFGGCLADDMGLGKTIQTIALFSFLYPDTTTPSLVVMPKSLLTNWQNELQKFNPSIKYYLYYGSTRDVNEFENHQVILTTYAMIRNDIEKLKDVEFETVVLDESQNIKNMDSKISKAVMLLNAKHRFALSGTPIENSLSELYALFRFINPGMFLSVNDFKRDYAVPIQSESNEEVAKVLKAKISPFILRRLKQDVLKELPPKQEQVIYIDMDENHKKFYNEKRVYYKTLIDSQIAVNGIEKSRFAILQAFNDLRQIASAPELKSDGIIKSSKIETLFEMLEDIVSSNHKVLLFANYLGSLDLIAQKANEYGMEYLMMTGSTKNRQEVVDKFQNDKKYSLFLMTLKVGGVGLNLTKADYVFIFDPWWNKSAENQAIDRAHRIGQKNTVFSYKMITKESIEEKILELQTQKQELTDMILSGDKGGLKQLSKSDLDYILG